MKYFLILLVFLSIFQISSAFASCGAPYDAAFHWLDRPCPDGLTDEEMKADWAEFYHFKGSEWMDYKTNEFETLMSNGFSDELLRDWIGQGPDYVPENLNFWNYYELFGNIVPQTKQKPVEIPLQEKRTCDESCKDRVAKFVNPYTCTKNQGSQNYTCAHKSAFQPTILLTSADETGEEMTFRPTETTVSLGINNTIRWHNTSFKTTLSNQEGVYESISIPFNDIKYQVLDKVGNYTFYDVSNPDVKIYVNVIPLDGNFNSGKPITKHGYFSDVRFQIFRANSDSQNFIHNIDIHDNNFINITLDNTMDTQYAVHDKPEMIALAKMNVGDVITSGCSYHHETYSRLFYHTVEKINPENNAVEFKEAVDYVQGNKCESLYADTENIVETVHGNVVLQNKKSPLKQIESGISIDEIQCKDSLILIQKYDGSPACVKPETKVKLSDRDWAKNGDYPFGIMGPIMSQQNCNDHVISQWQPTIEGREKVQQFLEICIQNGFMTYELVERGKIADNFTYGSIQTAKISAKGDIEKTIENLEEMHIEKTIENLEEMQDHIKTVVHVDVDKEEYHTDDVVMISGYVEGMVPGTELNITVRNPLMDMVFVSQVTISEDGTFTESVPIGGPLWKQNGIYSVSAQYGKATNHTDFLYLSDLESDDLL